MLKLVCVCVCVPEHDVSSVLYSADIRSSACNTERINTCSSVDSSFDDVDQDAMPPSSHEDRSSGLQIEDIFELVVIPTISRPRTESPKRDIDIVRGLGMHRIRSMPNLEYGRPSHNRSTGQTMFECGRAKGKEDAAVNVAEFETLLGKI